MTSFENIDKEFSTLTIPVQTYAKFTSDPDQMPKVVIDMWQKIWHMDAAMLGGERAYIADFEIYDERSSDAHNAITRSIIARLSNSSANISFHLSKSLLVVIMVDLFSYRLAIILKKSSTECFGGSGYISV